jgi:DNA polymerase-3 subunit delta'
VYRPFEGRRRVTIIDQADALVEAAQNALLKTLEEPLPASVFILVTSRPDVLLPNRALALRASAIRPAAGG